MEGVILFADNDIFNQGTFENALFKDLHNDFKYPVIAINSLDVFARTTKSISTYRAIILDWNFNDEIADIEDLGGARLPQKTTSDTLIELELFSIIFIYSRTQIAEGAQKTLKDKYGKKIEFILKGSDKNIKDEKQKLLEKLTEFEKDNQHLVTPFIWSNAINKSVQTIFNELERADPNWIKEIYCTSYKDGGEPNTEVIGVFQNLLNESIIQNETLTESLAHAATLADVYVDDKGESSAKLFNRIYYTQLLKNAPIMTGDIFKFSEDDFAVVITPECDVNSKKATALEFLMFSKNTAILYFEKKKKEKKKREDKGEVFDDSFFNNGIPSRHLLLSFPFEPNVFNHTALIEFESAFIVKSKSEFDGKRSEYKLNSPYIFQLRQRYLAYIGRVGVPAIPPSLKAFNLK